MFVRLLYGESDILVLNPNCCAKNFLDHVKEKCNFDENAIIDLCDENGMLVNIHSKTNTENIKHLITHRQCYVAVLIEKQSDGSIKNILPLLIDWDKKYPQFERKLKQQTAAADKLRKSGNEAKKRLREKEKTAGLTTPESPSRRSSLNTNSGEISRQKSQPNKESRRK